MIRVCIGPGLLGALVLLTAGLCHAQEEDDTDAEESDSEESDSKEGGSKGLGGRSYIGIDTQLFGTSSAKITTVTTSPTGFPTTSTVDYTTTQIGLASPSWGFGFGYAVGDYVSLGARLMFESATVSVGNAESKATGVGFAPNVKALMSANQDVVPYASVMFGYKKLTTEGNGGSTGDIDGVMYGGGLGLFLLPNPNVSFEPSFSLLWNSIKDELSTESVTAMGFYFGLSLSAWFGDDKPATHRLSEEDSSPALRATPSSQTIEPSSGKLNAYLRSPDYELHVTIDPNDEIPQFHLTLLMSANDAAGCDTLQLSGPEGTVSLPTELDKSLDKRRQIVSAAVPYQALKIGIGKGKAHVAVCDMTWKLKASEREKLLKLIALFRARARTQGTFEAAAAVPAFLAEPEPNSPSQIPPVDGASEN